ncbi:hypothetical protein DASB73_002420 [Starmerella bacillaris]|uniref:Ribosomal RNA-processing protein 7 C-terminal domain-containing protein n=1 Tax=Starmerella bacillaris TaxID=1247836 RepID=A0AAV5RCI9_STABA|nr:hypothetical protein DASB73_002420 [Starmerella bacillaris]
MTDYIPVPLNVGPNTVHTIYVRKHVDYATKNSKGNSDSDSDSDSDSNSDSDSSRSAVFMMNLPIDITDDNVKDLCEAFGNVHLIEFERLGTRHGLVILADDASVSRFLSKAKKLNTTKDGKSKSKKAIVFQQYGPKGVEGYIAKHYSKFPSEQELAKKADEYMELLAERERIEAEEAMEASTKVDEDGFQLVVYKNRKRLADIPPPVVEAPKKKKTMEKDDFYKFQLRANRKQEMTDLLQRFQEDKAKIEELKKKKKFKPF